MDDKYDISTRAKGLNMDFPIRVDILTPNENIKIYAKSKEKAFINDTSVGKKVEAWEYVGMTRADHRRGKDFCNKFVVPRNYVASEVHDPTIILPDRVVDNPAVVIRIDGKVEHG